MSGVKFKNPLLVVTDMERSKAFCREVMGLRVIMDFGANVTLTGGVCLQTKESWLELIQAEKSRQAVRDGVVFGGLDAELYFEEDDFDAFIEKAEKLGFLEYVHPAVEHPWGQRVVRFYDPDRHVIEVGEKMETVCRRFLDAGMTAQEIAERMNVPIKFVNHCIRAGEKHGVK